MEMTKAAFARRVGVSDTRVSQWIRDGILSGAALKGEGRKASILVEVAEAQIAERRHPGQALGNGLGTKVVDAPAPSEPGESRDPQESSLARQLQEQKLEEAQRKNRIAAREEAERGGQLMSAVQVRAEMGRVLQAIEEKNAGMLSDFASAIAGQFGLSPRDVLHLLRKVRAEKRGEIAAEFAATAAAAPATVDVEIGEPA